LLPGRRDVEPTFIAAPRQRWEENAMQLRRWGTGARIALVVLGLLGPAAVARAGVPFINLDGVGGVAFNPLAYPAGNPDGLRLGPVELAKPSVGTWYVNLNQSEIDWHTLGVATSLNKRLELSYGYETIAINGAVTIRKHNLGAKLLLLPENSFGSSAVPAIAVGAVRKSSNLPGAKHGSGFEYYLVATKVVTLGRPILLSAGALYSKAMVDGVLGFSDEKAKLTFYGNVDLVATDWLAIGAEVKQGPKYADGYEDAFYYNVHAGWLVTASTTVAIAYAHPGKVPEETGDPVGFGKGVVVGLQHVF